MPGWNQGGGQSQQSFSGNGRQQNQGKPEAGQQGSEIKEYLWTEFAAGWKTKDGGIVFKAFDPEATGEAAVHEHRKLGYKLAATARGDSIFLKENEDKEPGSKQPDFFLLMRKYEAYEPGSRG